MVQLKNAQKQHRASLLKLGIQHLQYPWSKCSKHAHCLGSGEVPPSICRRPSTDTHSTMDSMAFGSSDTG